MTKSGNDHSSDRDFITVVVYSLVLQDYVPFELNPKCSVTSMGILMRHPEFYLIILLQGRTKYLQIMYILGIHNISYMM